MDTSPQNQIIECCDIHNYLPEIAALKEMKYKCLIKITLVLAELGCGNECMCRVSINRAYKNSKEQ